MRNTHMAFLAILLVLVLYPLSLFSASLDEIIQSAYASSDEMKRYELDKRNAELAVSIGEAKDELGIEVSSGNVTAEYQPDYNAYVFNTSGPEATFTLPNDGKTAIKVGTGSIAYSPDGNVFSLKPSASVSHSILLGDSSDNRSSLLNKQNKLLGTYSYQSNLIQFENSIINQISSLLTNQKSINETMKNIVIQQKAMSDALALKTVGKDSVAYQEQVHTLANLESTLASLQGNKALLESQYTQLTSLSWDGIPVLREPKLDFEKNPNGNTSVALKALALDIANEDLKLAKAELTNKKLQVMGGASVSAVNPVGAQVNSIKANVGTTYSANNYSFGGSVSGSYNVDTRDFSPKLTVSGSWNNNATQLTETLNIQKLENNAMLASITYNDALQEYLYTASSLQSQIAAWKLEYSLLESSASYHVQALEQQQALFAKGLTTKSNVDIARFTVEQDSYDRALTLLKGLVIENSIRSLQIQGR
ncbi:TolC family protein [Sphaerochaeta sp. PS]|uniref:TolC family protein n=1 Tax=Sphaerochaeta sp. PS TaxID=3076336 RepID=UPI0028A4C301|nr:TolC family protein [Sphaerochaeta sp. PS]MDT4761890.1 TolC family protein [Sphaerochaeta sp. PS]